MMSPRFGPVHSMVNDLARKAVSARSSPFVFLLGEIRGGNGLIFSALV